MSSAQKSVTVCITGAAGQIAYSLLPHICGGKTFGCDTKVTLHLLDLEAAMPVLNGVLMELDDCSYPLLQGVKATTSTQEAFTGCDYVIMLGAFPRLQGMERKDLLEKNAGIFSVQGKALNEVSSPNVKVLVVGNPANTNAWIASQNAPKIPKKNFSALTRLDHNRCRMQIALKAKVPVSQVHNVAIWGNHSATQFPDVSSGYIETSGAKVPIQDALSAESAWLQGEMISTVQQRGAAVIAARKMSSALSAAHAISDHMHDWVLGTAEGEAVSMGVVSDGSYDIEAGLVYSFPVTCKDGEWHIVQGLDVSDFARGKMTATLDELKQERDVAATFL